MCDNSLEATPQVGGVAPSTCHDNFKMADVLSKLKALAQQHRTLAQCVGVVTGSLLSLAAFLSSYFHVVVVLWVFGLGLMFCTLAVRPEELFPNLLPSFTRKKKILGKEEAELSVLKAKCPVCGNEKCKRHRPELNIVALQPWTNIRLPQTVDTALEEFLNLVLKEFVYTWYRDLSQDEAFVDELRSSLRFVASVLLRRVQKVDIPSLVLQKVLKVAIRHLHFYLEVRRKDDSGRDIQEAVLDCYNGSLHIAVRNRRAELDYIKAFVERVFPYILPIQSHNCKALCVLLREILAGAILLPAMDVLADPDIINNLLLIFFDRKPPSENPNPPSTHVPILQNFSQPLVKNDSCLHMELDDILENADSLFHFMQFLKAEASVNVLQFYLAVDEFNNKLLNPELSQRSLSKLHTELSDMYRLYCDHAAVDRIQFDEEIISQLKQISEGPPEGVIKLQTTTPLFRAHEHMYVLLKDTFLPLFHQSDDYYKMLCGERLPTSMIQKSATSTPVCTKPVTTVTTTTRAAPRRQDSANKISAKLKTVFKPPTIDGRMPTDDIDYGSEDGDVVGNGILRGQEEDLLPSNHHMTFRRHDDAPLRDLSAWRVTVPEVVTKFDLDNPKRETSLFVVEVRRVDVIEDDFESSVWTVERRYQEFYVLDQKLNEFHGEFSEIHLPSKKAFGTKKKEFLESIRPTFEQYLQHLLSLHILKGSELLYTFLTPYSDFASSIFPDINLGKMMKSGALKLVKERGQHLEPFLQSLLQSTETAKPKPSRFSDKDSDTASISSEKMANYLYENNANTDLSLLIASSPSHSPSKSLDLEVPVDGIVDTIVYLAETLFNSQPWILQLLLSARIVARRSVDSFLDWYLGRKMEYVSQEHKVVQLIHLLRDALFFDNDAPRTEDEKLERKERTLKELRHFIPKIFSQGLGMGKFEEGTELLLEALQQPKLNKQLSYVLLDVAIEELFPEIFQHQDPLADLHRHLNKHYPAS